MKKITHILKLSAFGAVLTLATPSCFASTVDDDNQEKPKGALSLQALALQRICVGTNDTHGAASRTAHAAAISKEVITWVTNFVRGLPAIEIRNAGKFYSSSEEREEVLRTYLNLTDSDLSALKLQTAGGSFEEHFRYTRTFANRLFGLLSASSYEMTPHRLMHSLRYLAQTPFHEREDRLALVSDFIAKDTSTWPLHPGPHFGLSALSLPLQTLETHLEQTRGIVNTFVASNDMGGSDGKTKEIYNILQKLSSSAATDEERSALYGTARLIPELLSDESDRQLAFLTAASNLNLDARTQVARIQEICHFLTSFRRTAVHGSHTMSYAYELLPHFQKIALEDQRSVFTALFPYFQSRFQQYGAPSFAFKQRFPDRAAALIQAVAACPAQSRADLVRMASPFFRAIEDGDTRALHRRHSVFAPFMNRLMSCDDTTESAFVGMCTRLAKNAQGPVENLIAQIERVPTARAATSAAPSASLRTKRGRGAQTQEDLKKRRTH